MAFRTARGLGLLLATVASATFGTPTFAATAQDARDAKIEQLEQEIKELSDEVKALKESDEAVKQAVEAAENTATLGDQVAALKTSTADQYADIQNQRNADVHVTIDNARSAFTSADGRFMAQLRALMQYDTAYYSQSAKTSLATDLSSGTNFRRARLGLEGRAFGVWSYGFIYDFGGSSGAEQQGRISDSYIQYDGLAPFHVKTGSFAPNVGIDDQGTGDLLFLERAAPAELARGIAAADGRQNFINVFANDKDYFASVSWTGAKSADSIFFDEQQALVGRFAYRVLQNLEPASNTNVIVSANATYVYKVADIAASPSGTSPITLAIVPENYVDATKLVSTGAIDTDDYFQWGLEAAGNWNNFYAQGGYFGYQINRRASALADPNFGGWYAQASWVITGESRRYNAATASWAGPAPTAPVDLNATGLGAWEFAARYSVIDLDYRAGPAGDAAPIGGIRGGKQKAWALGLNWYPNVTVRFEFDYQNVTVDRLAATAPFAQIGQGLDIFSTRAQVAF